MRINNTFNRDIHTSANIRQGDSLSPLLFNTVMDQITDVLKNKGSGYRMGQNVNDSDFRNRRLPPTYAARFQHPSRKAPPPIHDNFQRTITLQTSDQ